MGWFPKPFKAALIRFDQIEKDAEGRGFSAAVRPQDTEDLALFNFQRKIFDGLDLSVSFGKSLNG